MTSQGGPSPTLGGVKQYPLTPCKLGGLTQERRELKAKCGDCPDGKGMGLFRWVQLIAVELAAEKTELSFKIRIPEQNNGAKL